MGITWGPEGVLQLRDNENVLVQTVEEVTNFPTILAAKIAVPPRSLVMVAMSTSLLPYDNKTLFDFVPLETNVHLGPNCIVYPLAFATIRGGQQKTLQVLINLGEQELKLS